MKIICITIKNSFMKRNVFLVSFVLLSLCMFFSCLDDNENTYVSYGVIRNFNSTNNYEIFTDKGNTLVVTKTGSSQFIENGKRVLVNYSILSDKDKDKKVYEVSVNGFYNLLSKALVYESFILQDEEVRRDSIGNDPFNRLYAGFGGEYINIAFDFWFDSYSNQTHLINLVYDDIRADADTIYLTLYHNAYGEVPDQQYYLSNGTGRCSFKISDLLPAGLTSKPVKLTWTQYGYNEPIERSYAGTFKLGDLSETYSLSHNIEQVSSVTIK